MRATFSTALVFTLVAASCNATSLKKRQGEPLSSIESSSTTSSSSAPTSTATAPGPAEDFEFVNPSGITTCQSVPITWTYTGSSADVTLAVTNADVDQTGINPAPVAVIQGIGSGIDVGLDSYTWAQANISEGYYIFIAEIGTIGQVKSQPFLVSTGSDTSCLTSPSSSSTTSSTSSATSTVVLPTSSQSSTVVPVPVSSTKKTNVGAIAGGIVAGIIVLMIIGFIIMVLLRRKNRSARARRFSSAADPFASAKVLHTGSGRHHAPSESTGGMLSDIGPRHRNRRRCTFERGPLF